MWVILLQEFNARLGHGYFMAIKNQRDAIWRHVDDPCTAKHRTWVVTGIKKDGTAAMRWYKLTFVNESGFYALVLGSKLPTAVKFKNWVIFDVLLQLKYPNLRIFRGFCNMNLRIFVYFMEILSGTNADDFWQ